WHLTRGAAVGELAGGEAGRGPRHRLWRLLRPGRLGNCSRRGLCRGHLRGTAIKWSCTRNTHLTRRTNPVMSLLCSHCSRLNPRDAAFCYHDGRPLEGATAGQPAPGVQTFATPLVLPSGRKCHNFDQLALACQDDWTGALQLVRDGGMERFLAALGRADLAQAARAAANFPDADRGLDQFLAALPSQAVAPPQLHVATTEFDLGAVPVGIDQRLELRLANRGRRLLYGAAASDVPWLVLGEAPGSPQKLFQCATETTIPILIVGKRLRAGGQPLEGRLVVDS